MEKLDIFKITIDEEYGEGEDLGISQIAFTKTPAIKVKGLAFKEDKPKKMIFTDNIKMRIAAPALIPMTIYRNDEMGEYYVQFTEEEVEKIFVKFMSNLNNKGKFNLEHNNDEVVPAFILETWMVGSDTKGDRSYTEFGVDVPKGTIFMVSQVTDPIYYQELVTNEQYGFSIEGFLGMKLRKHDGPYQKELQVDSFNDYPESAVNNAKRALKYQEENKTRCGTRVGWTRARQLANREVISEDTINRMAAFIRHQQNSKTPYNEGCGGLMWDAWGGTEGINWAIRKSEQLKKLKELKINLTEMEKETKMGDLYLPDGEWEIAGKTYVIEGGRVTEIIDENEMMEGEDSQSCNCGGSTFNKLQEEVTIDESIEEQVTEKITEPSIKEEEVMKLIEPKLEEIYKMIADLNVKLESKQDIMIEEKKVEEVKMSKQQAYSEILKKLK
jgi:hypothetical protein